MIQKHCKQMLCRKRLSSFFFFCISFIAVAIKTPTAFLEIPRRYRSVLSPPQGFAMAAKKGFICIFLREKRGDVWSVPHRAVSLKLKPKAAKRNTIVYAASGNQPQKKHPLSGQVSTLLVAIVLQIGRQTDKKMDRHTYR